jgi:NADPH2:quinone reductase
MISLKTSPLRYCYTSRVLTLARSMSSIPETMKAAVVRETGDANMLQYETNYPTPKLQKGQVIVKNEYSGVNFIDIYHRSGLYKRDLPFVGGQEGSGIVAAVSEEAANQGVQVGDRVAYSVFGSYAEYTAVPAAKLLPVPKEVGLDVAASLVVQGLTAHYLTTSAHANLIKPGEWCLIHGVGGGTCQWAAQMAKNQGYKVIGTCSKGKEDVARKLGCDELIVLEEVPGLFYEDYSSVDIVKRVMEVTNNVGCKAVIDGIGKSTMDISIDSLAHRGIFVSFGNASGAVPPFPVLRLINKSAYVTRPKLLDYIVTREELVARANDVFSWFLDGKLYVSVDKVFPLENASSGHMYLADGKSKGKVLYKC